MIKISKRIVEALDVQERDVDYFDDDLKGFGVRVRPSGRKTYFVMMRHKCVMRRFTIGSHGAVTAEAARLKAKQIISDLAIDKNPTAGQIITSSGKVSHLLYSNLNSRIS